MNGPSSTSRRVKARQPGMWLLRLASVGALVTGIHSAAESAGVILTLQGEGRVQVARGTAFQYRAATERDEKVLKPEADSSRLDIVERNPETGGISFSSACYDFDTKTAYITTRADVHGQGQSSESAICGP